MKRLSIAFRAALAAFVASWRASYRPSLRDQTFIELGMIKADRGPYRKAVERETCPNCERLSREILRAMMPTPPPGGSGACPPPRTVSAEEWGHFDRWRRDHARQLNGVVQSPITYLPFETTAEERSRNVVFPHNRKG